jgi:sporulation protein YlmC with PRC-barrel domain
MKTLLSTTALVVALGFPTLTLAQTAPVANPGTQQQNLETSGFLAERGQSDLFASDLMGHDVYARRTPAQMTTDGQAAMNADGTHGMATMARADLDEMDNIGQINEIILSHDGQVRALVIGVGGFLGVGEQDVAVTMDQVTFASDPDDRSQMYVVVNTGADMLKGSPAYDRTAAMSDAAIGTDAAEGDAAARTERAAFTAPQMERDGYDRVEVTEVTTETLMGKSVYDVNDNDVGTVTDMIIDDAGAITNVIIDFGGFLGIGVSQASLSFDELTILSTEGYDDVRVYVDATKEQIQELPQYRATN